MILDIPRAKTKSLSGRRIQQNFPLSQYEQPLRTLTYFIDTLHTRLRWAAETGGAATGRRGRVVQEVLLGRAAVVKRCRPLRQRDGDPDCLVEPPPPWLDGNDGTDGTALHQDFLHHLVFNPLYG